ncbi:response regulator transcription factor [Paucibacter sp. R3-3]|uniref:Response regulator transcription factor n=1 Tax=Roseateles agri TaxID=3098619 RepID=A0ABU5DMX7_9BURK|nr:response regulator transcription factor [Paucibacter sp. R3-3]MDY0746412.1 response regulator transcription factor [Paucibacter sp. R3-3]
MIRALVVDDHTIFRSGLKRLLLDESDIRVTGEARCGSEALEALRLEPFDVVVLDINLEGRSGLDVLATIRREHPGAPVLMLSMYPEEQYALVAMRAGASGYVAKDAEPAELIAALRAVARGGTYLSMRIAPLIQDQLKGLDERPPHQRLSVREHQIMLMLLKGVPPADIGEEMMISTKTVSAHRTHILEKLGVSSTAELVLYAVRNGIIQ